MKTFFSIAAALTGLASLVAGNTCDAKSCGDCGMFINSWNIQHDGGVDFSEPFCKGFWDNLGCPGASVRACGNGADDGKGFIQFNAGIACGEEDVEAAWWLATKNEFGAIDCIYSSKLLRLIDRLLGQS